MDINDGMDIMEFNHMDSVGNNLILKQLVDLNLDLNLIQFLIEFYESFWFENGIFMMKKVFSMQNMILI